MRRQEAIWVGAALTQFPADQISPLLEVGSGTLSLRTVEKPHIDEYLHAPLRRRGVKVVHTDMKAGEGIDICGDIFDPSTTERLRGVGAKCVLCCNVFEHIRDPGVFARACDGILQPGGLMVVTAPKSFPYHLDPIDTYYRPSPDEIAALFPGYTELTQAIITSDTFLTDIARERNPPLFIMRQAAKIALMRGGLEQTKSRAHRWLWLFSPYELSAVILRKPN